MTTRTPDAYRAMASKYLADKAVMEAQQAEAMTKDKPKYQLGIAAMADAARRHQDLAEHAEQEGRL
jgi:hypothetical protein